MKVSISSKEDEKEKELIAWQKHLNKEKKGSEKKETELVTLLTLQNRDMLSISINVLSQ